MGEIKMIEVKAFQKDLTSETEYRENQESIGLGGAIHQTYHELAEFPVVETDVIEQLKYNMARLEDLHGRLGFLMTEIKGILKA